MDWKVETKKSTGPTIKQNHHFMRFDGAPSQIRGINCGKKGVPILNPAIEVLRMESASTFYKCARANVRL